MFMLYLSCEKNENKQKEAGFGPFFFKKKQLLLLRRAGPVRPAWPLAWNSG